MIGRITLGGGIAAGATAGVGWAIARRLTAPVGPRTFDLLLRGVEHDGSGDLIVLDRDLMTCPVDEVKGIKVTHTIVGGKVVYQKK